MPESYGVRDPRREATPLPWDWVVDRMSRARSYWVATSRRDGAPHVVPVWGLWFEGGFCFFTDGTSQKSRNVQRDPRAAVHLESGDEVVVLEGKLDPETDLGTVDRAARAYESKYEVDVAAGEDGPVMYRLTHSRVLAWDEGDFPRTATRWRFGSPGPG
ncbi:MAG: pyridoxamine 5'-phosphate oxidase family protein [Dehalococcoidia bacterium]|nr:pyridoxamine 5'-phosphate oxidase family protein [Dehalococcoidia bacterium]